MNWNIVLCLLILTSCITLVRCTGGKTIQLVSLLLRCTIRTWNITVTYPTSRLNLVENVLEGCHLDLEHDFIHATTLAYTEGGQLFSVANYWNDPHHQDLYRKYSKFLPVLNNDTNSSQSAEFKSNFLRLKKLVLIGGPNDGVIIPWQSSQFGFYDENLQVVEMKKQKWYVEDSFGLRTLRKRNAISQHTVPGMNHTQWHTNRMVFEKYILPYLT